MAPHAADANRNTVASLRKGLDVLTSFDRLHPRLTVSEVARRTGATPASARRSLLTLQSLGYLGSDGKHFWMLPKSLLVANAYLSSRPTTSLAQPFLDGLSERTRESASIGRLIDDHAIIIARSTARRSLSAGLGIGSRLPAYCSALGRMLLAGLAPKVATSRLRRMALEALTPLTVVDLDAVIAHVDAARERGYSTSDGELETGVRSMAVPVFNHAGDAIAAMSIAVRGDRASIGEMVETFLPAMLRAQAQLAKKLFDE